MQWVLKWNSCGLSGPAKAWSTYKWEETSRLVWESLKILHGLVGHWAGKDRSTGVLDHCGPNARPVDFGNECHSETHLARRAIISSAVTCPGSSPGSHSVAASIKCSKHPQLLCTPNLGDHTGSVPRCHFGGKVRGREEIQRLRLYPTETQPSKRLNRKTPEIPQMNTFEICFHCHAGRWTSAREIPSLQKIKTRECLHLM